MLDQDSVLSPEEVKREMRARGMSAADWARAHGFEMHVVYGVLNRRTRGYRGKAYEAAVALGLVPRPDQSGRFQHLFGIDENVREPMPQREAA